MTRDIASIVESAFRQARGCVLNAQATEAGYLFGSHLVESERSEDRRNGIQTSLAGALAETAPGSHARAFMNAVVSALNDAWGHLS